MAGHLLALQQSAGNAAVSHLLVGRSGAATDVVVQRVLMSADALAEAAGGYAGGKHKKGTWVELTKALEAYREFIDHFPDIGKLGRDDQGEALRRLRGLDRLIDRWMSSKRHQSGKLAPVRGALDRLRYQSGVEQLQIEKRGHGPVGHGFIGLLGRPLSPVNPRYVPEGEPRFLGAQGWKLHVSFHPADIRQVNDTVLPFLSQRRFAHKLIGDVGRLKDNQTGKMLVVYPVEEGRHRLEVKGATVVDGLKTVTCDVSIVVVDRGSAAVAAGQIAEVLRKAAVRTGPEVPDDDERFNEYAWGREGAFGDEYIYRIAGSTFTRERDSARAKEDR